MMRWKEKSDEEKHKDVSISAIFATRNRHRRRWLEFTGQVYGGDFNRVRRMVDGREPISRRDTRWRRRNRHQDLNSVEMC